MAFAELPVLMFISSIKKEKSARVESEGIRKLAEENICALPEL
jgi:hypothetical protein